MTFVIDASMILSWHFPDEKNPQSDVILRRLAAEPLAHLRSSGLKSEMFLCGASDEDVRPAERRKTSRNFCQHSLAEAAAAEPVTVIGT